MTNKRKIQTIVFLGALIVGFAPSNPIVVSADTTVDHNIYLDEHWVLEKSPYIVRGTVTVHEDAKLIVDPGVEIRLQNLTIPRIDVYGELLARGTEDMPIVLSGEPGMNLYVFGGIARFSHASSSGYFHGHSLSGGRLDIAASSFEGGSLYVSDSSIASFSSVKMRTSHDIQALGGSRLNLRNVTIDDSLGVAPIRVVDGSFLAVDGLNLKPRPESTGVLIDSSHATITRAVIVGGAKGIEATASQVVISESAIENQSAFSVLNQGPGVPIVATRNYWGDSSGPYHPTQNPSGRGSSVSDSVQFMPWLTERPTACCSSVLFLPGLKASRLYMNGDDGEERLWEPLTDGDIELLELDGTGSSKENVYVRDGDVIEEAYASFFGPNIYKSFIADLRKLREEGVIGDWNTFSYDWRGSVDQVVSSALMQKVSNLSSGSKTGKVTIVAHSYGGLVAKKLVQTLEELGGQGIIDKVILVASPQSGAPHAIGAVLHGYREGIPMLSSAESMRILASNMPSAYGLMPSGDWQSIVAFSSTSSLPWIRRMRDDFGTVVRDALSLGRFLKDAGEGRGEARASSLAIPAILNPSLMDEARSLHESLDSWSPSPGIRLIQIAGRGIETVMGMSYYQGKKYGASTLLHRPILSLEGDGVVPLRSSWLLESCPNVERVWIDLAASNKGISPDHEHADIFEVPALRSYIVSVIGSLPDEPQPIVRREENAFISQEAATRIFLHASSSELHIYNAEGMHAGASQAGLIENEIPDVRYREFGDISYARIPRIGSGLKIRLQGVSDLQEAVVVEVEEVIGGHVSTSTIFEDLRIPTSTVLTVDLGGSASSAPMVGFDLDDDGDVDEAIISEEAHQGESSYEAGGGGLVVIGKDPAFSAASKGSRSRGSVSSSRIAGVPEFDPLIYIDVPAGEAVRAEISEDVALGTGGPQLAIGAQQSVSVPEPGNLDQAAALYGAILALLDRINTLFLFIAEKIGMLFEWTF